MAASLLGDPSMTGGPWPRLPDARIEAEIADELLRTVEALDRADSRHERQRDDHVDAGNRHQTRDTFVGQRRTGKVALDRLEVFAKPVALAQTARSHGAHQSGELARSAMRGPSAHTNPDAGKRGSDVHAESTA